MITMGTEKKAAKVLMDMCGHPANSAIAFTNELDKYPAYCHDRLIEVLNSVIMTWDDKVSSGQEVGATRHKKLINNLAKVIESYYNEQNTDYSVEL